MLCVVCVVCEMCGGVVCGVWRVCVVCVGCGGEDEGRGEGGEGGGREDRGASHMHVRISGPSCHQPSGHTTGPDGGPSPLVGFEISEIAVGTTK